MKTLCFHSFKVGRANNLLLEIDSQQDDITLVPGLNLVVAPNGYGKSTLLQTLAGVIKPLSGRISLLDSERNAESEYLPGRDALMISEYLTFPKFIFPDEWIEFMSGKKPLASRMNPHWKGLRLEPLRDKYLGRMSQGERRKVTWLAAHSSERPVLLLDEPLDGLDLLAIDAARTLLKEWEAEGRIVLLIAHQISEVFDLSRQTLVFDQGRLKKWEKITGKNSSSIHSDEFRNWTHSYYSKTP